MKEALCLKSLLAAPAKEDGFASFREEAEVRARTLKLPGPKHESWRLTDLAYLYGQTFQAAEGAGELPDIAAQVIPEAHRIVFVDGRFSSKLSDLPEIDNVKVSPLGLEDAGLHEHFGQSMQDEVFAQLNARNFEDCAFIRVTGEVKQPIHVLHVSTKREFPVALYARCLVVLEEQARATLIEAYAGEGHCFDNAMTEVVLQAQAGLRHVRVQREGDQAVHVGNTVVALERGSNYDATMLALGGRLSRHYLEVSHHGEGAEARLEGLTLVDGRQIADVHTRIDHFVPNCQTVQRQKCIAGGSSTAVFSGNIVVHERASGTDTKQESRNLLLSGKAKIDAQPQLEILNDDVSCRHGATVGQLDSEELFYLKSRGLSFDAARKLLIYAFAAEIVDRIPVRTLVESLRESMFGRLS